MTARSDSGDKDPGGSENIEETRSVHTSFEKNDVGMNQAVVKSRSNGDENLPEVTSLEVEEDQVILCALWFISVLL